ncbi:hypothetical protein [Streptomyces sp. NPDC002553]|uniref:hypothetical protein n=1 Tax=Streptomyces sp. NPDC002553 TaxID=3154417 RepID=UPI0033201FE5
MTTDHRMRETTIERLGPQPTTPLEALHHTLAVYEDQPDSRMVLEATSNIYGDGIRTGVTIGDLRALATMIAGNGREA